MNPAEIQQRTFYRNGETKSVSPNSEQSASEITVTSDPVITEPTPERMTSDPVVADGTTSSAASSALETSPVIEETTGEPAPVAQPLGINMGMIASGVVTAAIVIGGLLFLLRMLLRRFTPTISKEAITQSAAATIEPALPHLEAALGMKKGGPPAS